MKKKYMLIILASTVLGIFIGSIFRDYESKQEVYVNKDTLTKKEIKVTNKSIKKLRKEKLKLDKEVDSLKEMYSDVDQIKEIDKLKKEISYTDINGMGVIIKIDALNEEMGNISNLVDYNKILINIINELKMNGGKFISINGQRINQYSEIVLAGSHINVNSVPIAQPYEIKCIGDMSKLSNYVYEESDYIKSIKTNYSIKVELKDEKNISMEKMIVPNKLKYIKGE